MLLLSLLSARSNCWSDAEPNRSAKSPHRKGEGHLLSPLALTSSLSPPSTTDFCCGVAGGRKEIRRREAAGVPRAADAPEWTRVERGLTRVFETRLKFASKSAHFPTSLRGKSAHSAFKSAHASASRAHYLSLHLNLFCETWLRQVRQTALNGSAAVSESTLLRVE